jgi:ribose transport system ATP-binding protein/inositol transport system ATP-binding protein
VDQLSEQPQINQHQYEYILDCQNVSKSFGGTRALIDVDFRVKKGQVHALLGENGAGKSTLMKIIIGLYKADKGTILFEGKPYSVKGPAEATKWGVSMIHQELNPEPYLSIAESIFLKREDTIKRTPFLNKKETNRKAAELLEHFNFTISPTTLMDRHPPWTVRKLNGCFERFVISKSRGLRSFISPTAWKRFSRFAIPTPFFGMGALLERAIWQL